MKVSLPFGVVHIVGDQFVVRFGRADIAPVEYDGLAELAEFDYFTGPGDGVVQRLLGPASMAADQLLEAVKAELQRLGLPDGSIVFSDEVLRHYAPKPRNDEVVLIQGFATLNEQGEVVIVFGPTAEHPHYPKLGDEAISLLMEEDYSSLTRPDKTSIQKVIPRTPRDLDLLDYEIGQEVGLLRVNAAFSDFGGAQVSIEIEVDQNAFAGK